MKLTLKDRQLITDLVAKVNGQYTLEQYIQAGKYWSEFNTVWLHTGIPAREQLRLVCWYNFTHKPGSTEYKPKVILQAALETLKPVKKQSLFTLN